MDNKTIYRRLINVWNTGEFSRTDEWLADDYTSHQRLAGQPEGREGFHRAAQWFRTVFSEFVFTIDFMVSEGDRLVGRWSGQGTHAGDFLGIAATGKVIHLTGFDALRIAHGLVVEVWHQEDMVGLLRQMGVPGLPAITSGAGDG